ncbi:MAG TPA: hypothetical protein GX739_08255 [Firmicutes bacterium]|nr:hypothetical protein [Bacillota bacterium]
MGRGWVVFFAGLLCFAISFIGSLWFAQQFDWFGQHAPSDRGGVNHIEDLIEPDSGGRSDNGSGMQGGDSKLDSDGLGTISAAEQLYVGIHDQYVAIFKGRPGVGGILVEKTEIPIDKLPEFEVRNLRAGIPFASEEQKYSILEGLHFPL